MAPKITEVNETNTIGQEENSKDEVTDELRNYLEDNAVQIFNRTNIKLGAEMDAY